MTKSVLFFLAIAIIVVLAETPLLAKANPYSFTGEVSPDSETFPPRISVVTPINNTVYAVNRLPLVFNVTAPQSKTAASTIVQIVTYQADWMDKTVDVFMGGQEQVSLSLQFSNIPEGTHRIIIQALGSGVYFEGLSYKEFRISSSLEIKFTIDTIIPAISIQKIENVSTEEGIPLVFTVNEPISEVSYVLDKQQNITIQVNTTLPYLPVGKHNVTVFACDLAGNIGKSESTFFVFLQPEPIEPESFPITNIAIIITIIILTMATFYLLLYRRHRKTAKLNQ